MKRLTILGLIFLSMSVLFPQFTHAQDYDRWSLPEGARMRLGKGNVLDVAWSRGRYAPRRRGQRRDLALRCPHRGGKFPPDHRTFVQSQCGLRFRPTV